MVFDGYFESCIHYYWLRQLQVCIWRMWQSGEDLEAGWGRTLERGGQAGVSQWLGQGHSMGSKSWAIQTGRKIFCSCLLMKNLVNRWTDVVRVFCFVHSILHIIQTIIFWYQKIFIIASNSFVFKRQESILKTSKHLKLKLNYPKIITIPNWSLLKKSNRFSGHLDYKKNPLSFQ